MPLEHTKTSLVIKHVIRVHRASMEGRKGPWLHLSAAAVLPFLSHQQEVLRLQTVSARQVTPLPWKDVQCAHEVHIRTGPAMRTVGCAMLGLIPC